MSTPKKHSVIGLIVFVLVFGGINGWFLYKRTTAPKLLLSSSNGANNQFQLAEQKISPADIKKIVNANGYTLLLLNDARLLAGGAHNKGQLGVGPQEVIAGWLYQVAFPEGTKIQDISSSDSHSLALDTTGGVWAWGLNMSGQIGNASNANQNVPVKVLDGAASITAGYRFSAAAKQDGSLWAWGMSCDKNNPEFDRIIQEFAASATAGGSYYGGVDSGDTQDCINEQNLPIASTSPRRLEDASEVAFVSGGYGHLLWITNSGALWSWGCNQYAQLGREKTFNTQNSRTPGPVTSVQGKTFVSVSAGFRHSLAKSSDGQLWAWGHNSASEVSDDKSDTVNEPRAFTTPHAPELISAGYDSSAILAANGELYGVGDNASNRLSPGPAAVLSGFTKISDRVNLYTLGRESVVYIRNNQ